ncbi:histone-lysine n-methyltransferase [Diplodia corticola]|uniref:Histone-lysine n-methyltransferase n=1 Tax=Diplodia corticola TaxID=236234 RepID=A0A1J9RB23_9PEZI|nr:histone-lysine n-methyltransferase [Diplodia corticola]OJD37346.1 histone-lysine n-methyltransferase [Diplodia corticola]
MLSSAPPKPQGRPASPHSDSSTLSNITVADPIHPASPVAPASTPPTSQSDDQSMHEDASKHADPQADSLLARRHSSRARAAVATYNDKENAGTRIHTPAKYRKEKDTPLQSPHQPDTHQPEPIASTEPPTPSQSVDEPIHRRQSGRSRTSVVTYNDKENAGTRIHTPTKYIDGTYIRKTLHDPIFVSGRPESLSPTSDNGKKRASKRRASGLRAEFRVDSDDDSLADVQSASPRKSARPGQMVGKPNQRAASQLGKRGRDAFDAVKSLPVGSSKVALRKSDSPVKRQRKRAASEPTPEPGPQIPRPDLRYGDCRGKPWLNAGKYHNTGQDDFAGSLSTVPGHKPKNKDDGTPVNKALPLPMFLMAEKLDLYPKKKLPEHKRPFEPFQLPYDIFSPLPKEAKVKDWREMKKNEYKGEDAQEIKARAKDQCKKQRQMEASTCNCVGRCERDGCFNASLFFECDDRSCNLGPDCGNRQFTNLQKRYRDETRQGKYFKSFNVGVEVVETESRGHGVRAMRPFQDDQIVVEYIGEIITQQESDKRMNEVYKDHKCFYLMNFYDKLIIDGYRGNIARFVNHSCDPNCRMEKWTVNGEQRMALFANRPIMTGEELTWHYNFESYGPEQPCYCGSWNCAGVIGRRRNKPTKEPAIGHKRKSPDDADERPKKKPKVTKLVEAASKAASKTGKNLLSKTKEGLKGLMDTVTAATSTPTVENKKSRDERAARRSLAAAKESSNESTPEPSSSGRPVRATRQQQTAISPKKGAAQTALGRLQAEKSARRPGSRSSSAKTAATPEGRPRSAPPRTSTRSNRAISVDEEDEDEEPPSASKSHRATPTLARRVPKAKSPLSISSNSTTTRRASSIRKSTGARMVQSAKEVSESQSSNSETDSASTSPTELSMASSSNITSTANDKNSITSADAGAPVSTGKVAALKQARLSFLPNGLSFEKGDAEADKPTRKVVKKKSSRSVLDA